MALRTSHSPMSIFLNTAGEILERAAGCSASGRADFWAQASCSPFGSLSRSATSSRASFRSLPGLLKT